MTALACQTGGRNDQDFCSAFLGFMSGLRRQLTHEAAQAAKAEAVERREAAEQEEQKALLRPRMSYGRYSPAASPAVAERIAAAGGSDSAISEALRIDESTLTIWRRLYPALSLAMERGRAEFRRQPIKAPRPRCPRCNGWVDLVIEFGGEASTEWLVPRCLNCGSRFYRGCPVVSVNHARRFQREKGRRKETGDG